MEQCVRKQHDGKGQASNHGPGDLKSNELSTIPPRFQITTKVCIHNKKQHFQEQTTQREATTINVDVRASRVSSPVH